jgi:hypothetical protein
MIVEQNCNFDAEALKKSGKPTFVQAGIHSGEIDGKTLV